MRLGPFGAPGSSRRRRPLVLPPASPGSAATGARLGDRARAAHVGGASVSSRRSQLRGLLHRRSALHLVPTALTSSPGVLGYEDRVASGSDGRRHVLAGFWQVQYYAAAAN